MGLVEFFYAFHEHLDAVEQTYTGRLTVIEGLEVTAEVLMKDGQKSQLRKQGRALIQRPTLFDPGGYVGWLAMLPRPRHPRHPRHPRYLRYLGHPRHLGHPRRPHHPLDPARP